MRSVKHGGKKGSKRYRYKLSAVKRQNSKQKKKVRKIAGWYQKKKIHFCQMNLKHLSQIIDKEWNPKLTTRQNLASMGLAYDPNEAVKTFENI